MRGSIWFTCLCLALVSASGCGDAKKNAPAAVKGTVTLVGQKMPDGEISFSLGTGEAPTILPIKDGAFSGAVPTGKNRVEIRAYHEGPPLSTDPTHAPTKVNFIPDKYNSQSNLTADVTAGGPNDFKFDVTSH